MKQSHESNHPEETVLTGGPLDSKSESAQVARGLGSGVLAHVLAIAIILMLSFALVALFGQNLIGIGFAIPFIGIVQLIYMVPLYRASVRRNDPRGYRKGLVLAGALLVLLNASCFGLLVVG